MVELPAMLVNSIGVVEHNVITMNRWARIAKIAVVRVGGNLLGYPEWSWRLVQHFEEHHDVDAQAVD